MKTFVVPAGAFLLVLAASARAESDADVVIKRHEIASVIRFGYLHAKR